MRTLRLALAQINATVGDLSGNADKIIASIEQARTLRNGSLFLFWRQS